MPRWWFGLIVVFLYLEVLIEVTIKFSLLQHPVPVFKKPAPIEYNWTPGPYDHDKRYCWQEQRHGSIFCKETQV